MEQTKAREATTTARSVAEFVIPGDSVDLLRQNVARVEKLFHVDVTLSKTFQRGNTTMQWINLAPGESSEMDEMDNAKAYILSMANPEASIQVGNFPPSLYQSSLDDVEASSCAFLSFSRKGNSVTLQGSQLAVVLAQSMLESVLQDSKPDQSPGGETAAPSQTVYVTTDEECAMTGDDTTVKVPTDTINQEWLSAVASSHHRPRQDEPSLIRIPTSRSSPSSSPSSLLSLPRKVPSRTSPSAALGVVPDGSLFFVDRSGAHGKKFHTDRTTRVSSNNNDTSTTKNNDNNGNGKTSDSLRSKSDDANSGIAQQYMYLKDLGVAHHYSMEVIEEGLELWDMTDVVKPTEFLSILQFIAESGKPSTSSALHSATGSESSISNQNQPAPRNGPQKNKKLNSSPLPSSETDASVIIIDSDTENDAGGRRLADDIEAYVISSDDEQPQPPAKANKTKKLPNQAVASGGGVRQGGSMSPGQQRQQQHPVRGQIAPLPAKTSSQLRYIVIDGCNVAMTHGENKVFSVKGIQICIDYFLRRGHKVTAFVSGTSRQPKKNVPLRDRHLFGKLEDEGHLKFTPSRRLVSGKIISSYDDRFILNLAVAESGIVVSNDQYRDLYHGKPEYQDLIDNRLLPYMFVGDIFMPPDDPLGRTGPTLDQFLCTGGSGGAAGGASLAAASQRSHATTSESAKGQEKIVGRQKQYLPLQGYQARSDLHPSSSSKQWWQERPASSNFWSERKEKEKEQHEKQEDEEKNAGRKGGMMMMQTHSHQRKPNFDTTDLLHNARGLQFRSRGGGGNAAPSSSASLPHHRSEGKTKEMYAELSLMFTEPAQQDRLWVILQNHPEETDMTRLCNFVINALAM